MPAITPFQSIVLASFGLLLVLHWAWCCFAAYPIAFERKLKQGKQWVYIPLRWKGAHKFQMVLIARLLMVLLVAAGIFILSHYSRKTAWPWLAGFGLILGALILKLNALWLMTRYRQQEDAYYFLHDELRAKLESEGKDMADSAFKSLAAYQHQNLLRKADEQGKLLATLKARSRLSRKHRREIKSQEPVET